MAITSSSISSSEKARTAAPWRRFAIVFAAAAAGLFAVLIAAVLLIDPYDSGRSAIWTRPSVRPQGPRTANASRGRDPRFDGAIIGNSRTQLLSPQRLGEAVGGPFVQLSIPQTGPKEQVVLLDWFVRHRVRPGRGVVLGIDPFWCTADPALPVRRPFPFWLYAREGLAYLRGLARFDTLEEVPRRLAYLLDPRASRAAPDGFWDYGPEYLGPGAPDPAVLRDRLDRGDTGEPDVAAGGPFPAAAALAEVLAALPADLPVTLLFPPLYAPRLPAPGSPRAAGDLACKAAFAAAAATRPRTAVVDWRVERPETRDPALFFDAAHYREPIARLIEGDLAQALRGLP